MIDRMTATELANHVGCKVNQRCRMAAWLRKNHWKHEIDATGLPIVARTYYERKMGISDDKTKAKHAEEPNRQAFA